MTQLLCPMALAERLLWNLAQGAIVSMSRIYLSPEYSGFLCHQEAHCHSLLCIQAHLLPRVQFHLKHKHLQL